MTTPLVDIAICTHNRSKYVQHALANLLPQVPTDDSVRVTVVDNNSTDSTKTIVAELTETWPTLRYLQCTTQGLGYARNHALAETQATWLAFLDDDAEPADDWVAQLLFIIASNQFDAFGGVYYPWYAEGREPWFLDHYESNDKSGTDDEFRLTEGYFSGGIAAYRTDMLRATGGFAVTIGMNGQAIAYGEEIAAQRRMAMAGARLGFSRRWSMRHLTPLRKQRWQWAWKKQYALGRDFWHSYNKPRQPALLRRYVAAEIMNAMRATREAFTAIGKGRHWKNCLYESARWARVCGLCVGYFACRRDN